jgi:hypothetical protein
LLVERGGRVSHPIAHGLRPAIDKNHAVVFANILSEHEPLLLFEGGDGNLQTHGFVSQFDLEKIRDCLDGIVFDAVFVRASAEGNEGKQEKAEP